MAKKEKVSIAVVKKAKKKGEQKKHRNKHESVKKYNSQGR
jgi:hypothetical protein